jgi:hypothetical protein
LKMMKLMKLNKKEWRYSTFLPLHSTRTTIAVPVLFGFIPVSFHLMAAVSPRSKPWKGRELPSELTLESSLSFLFLCFLLW